MEGSIDAAEGGTDVEDSKDIFLEDDVAHSSHNQNPTGQNQHPDCHMLDSMPFSHWTWIWIFVASKNDAKVKAYLKDYHHQNITNAKTIRDLLLKDHDVKMRFCRSRLIVVMRLIYYSEWTILHHRKALGLMASGATTCALPTALKNQLIQRQLSKDPLSCQGPHTIKERLANDTGIHLTWYVFDHSSVVPSNIPLCSDYITDFMCQNNPDGFALQELTAQVITQTALVAIGIHHEWSCDGHDKLTRYGFPIWGVKDKWSSKWLGLWVVPDNRLRIYGSLLWQNSEV
jgi:hypothetical protein